MDKKQRELFRNLGLLVLLVGIVLAVFNPNVPGLTIIPGGSSPIVGLSTVQVLGVVLVLAGLGAAFWFRKR